MDRGIGRGETWNAWVNVGGVAKVRECHPYRFGNFNRTNSAFSSIQIRQFHPDTFLAGKSWGIYATNMDFKTRLAVTYISIQRCLGLVWGERESPFSPLFSCRFSRIFLNKRDRRGI